MTIKRHIYVVTVRGHGVPEGMTLGPLLGVFSNENRAINHYEHVLLDRVKRGWKELWRIARQPHHAEYDTRICSALVRGPEYDEEITVEAWPLS